MKIALYIVDGAQQLVLTPENKHERAMLGLLHDSEWQLDVKRGSFYECQGGWYREGANGDSTMLVMRKKPPEPGPTDGGGQ